MGGVFGPGAKRGDSSGFGSKNGTQNGALVNGHMDSSGLILTHAHLDRGSRKQNYVFFFFFGGVGGIWNGVRRCCF